MLGHRFRFISYLIILFGINSKFLIFTIENLTEQLQKEREKYKHLAEYDKLTGLYTRNFFNEWILNRSKISKGNEKDVLIIIELDYKNYLEIIKIADFKMLKMKNKNKLI